MRKRFPIVQYTGKAWKHHVAEDFLVNGVPVEGGAAYGGTIFLDYDFMLDYLKHDGREWYIAELDLQSVSIRYDFNSTKLATVLDNVVSKEGFKPLK